MEINENCIRWTEDSLKLKKPTFLALLGGDLEQRKLELLTALNFPLQEFILCHKFIPGKQITSSLRDDAFVAIGPCKFCITWFLVWTQIWLLNDEDFYFISRDKLKAQICTNCERRAESCVYTEKHREFTEIMLCECRSTAARDERPCILRRKDIYISFSSRRAALVNMNSYMRRVKAFFGEEENDQHFFIRMILSHWLRVLEEEMFRFIFGHHIPKSVTYTGGLLEVKGPVAMHSSLSILSQNLTGNGIYLNAYSALPAQALILSVSENESINLYSCFTDPSFLQVALHLVQHSTEMYTESMILLIYLIYDRFSRDHPRYKSYYESLPSFDDEKNHNLLLAPPEIVPFLEIPNLEQTLALLNRKLFSVYESCITQLASQFPLVFDDNVFTWKRFLWARWLIDTRGFLLKVAPGEDIFLAMENEMTIEGNFEEIEKKKKKKKSLFVAFCSEGLTTLLPSIDKFNHHPLVATCRSPEFNTVSRRYEVRTEVPLINEGELPLELYMSYGPCETWQLLLYYGFVPPRYPSSLNLVNAHYGFLSDCNIDTLRLNIIADGFVGPVNADSFSIRDIDFANPAISASLEILLEESYSSVETGLNVLLQPLVEKTVSKVEFLHKQKSSSHEEVSWFPHWGERLTNFFECRLEFLLKHIGIEPCRLCFLNEEYNYEDDELT